MTEQLVVPPSLPFDVSIDLGADMTGLVGTLGVRLLDPGVQEIPIPRTLNISEFPAGSGIYGATLTAPAPPGIYVLMWDTTENGAGPFTLDNSWGDQIAVAIEDPTFPGGWTWTPYGWLEEGWGEFDVSGGSPGSNPIPTAANIRAASKLDFCEYGYAVANDANPGGLQEIVDQAESMFWRVTGQTLDEITPNAPGSNLSPGPAPLVRRVITGMTEHFVMAGSPDTLDTQSDWDLIQSFSAGPYSETRRGAADMMQGRMLFPVPWISMALWSLCSFERYSFWIQFFSGVNMPAWETGDVFWTEGLELGSMWRPDSPGGYWHGA
jgi:hypothetical protein